MRNIIGKWQRHLRLFFASLRMTSRVIVLAVEAILRVRRNIKRGTATSEWQITALPSGRGYTARVVKWGEIWRSRKKKKLNQNFLMFVLFYFSRGENIFIYAKFSCENMRIKLLNTNFLIRMCVYVKLKIVKVKFLNNDNFIKILNEDV